MSIHTPKPENLEVCTATDLLDSYPQDHDALQSCAQEVQDFLDEFGISERSDMISWQLNQLQQFPYIFKGKLPIPGTPVLLTGQRHVDEIDYRAAKDEIAVALEGPFSAVYKSCDIAQYTYQDNVTIFGLVVRSIAQIHGRRRVLSTPILGSGVYPYSIN